ncbi:hypothetical protein PR048_029611 [Dryococelus australis]|uniref:Uncharacterized protein n=1 Tax=Dryococelus australis TaxID=614101 RepID=A0ABQ9GE64_9NEOP|nr:hypothetical protein PR048_029611 [Dryococelus australis]
MGKLLHCSPTESPTSVTADCLAPPCTSHGDKNTVGRAYLALTLFSVIVEQHRNERAGETGDPRENPPANGIVRHDSHLRKSGSPAGDRIQFGLVGDERANRSATVAPLLSEEVPGTFKKKIQASERVKSGASTSASAAAEPMQVDYVIASASTSFASLPVVRTSRLAAARCGYVRSVRQHVLPIPSSFDRIAWHRPMGHHTAFVRTQFMPIPSSFDRIAWHRPMGHHTAFVRTQFMPIPSSFDRIAWHPPMGHHTEFVRTQFMPIPSSFDRIAWHRPMGHHTAFVRTQFMPIPSSFDRIAWHRPMGHHTAFVRTQFNHILHENYYLPGITYTPFFSREKQRRNARAWETGDLRGNSPTSGIVRHDSHICINLEAIPPGTQPGSPWWEARSLTTTPPRSHPRLIFFFRLILYCAPWDMCVTERGNEEIQTTGPPLKDSPCIGETCVAWTRLQNAWHKKQNDKGRTGPGRKPDTRHPHTKGRSEYVPIFLAEYQTWETRKTRARPEPTAVAAFVTCQQP